MFLNLIRRYLDENGATGGGLESIVAEALKNQQTQPGQQGKPEPTPAPEKKPEDKKPDTKVEFTQEQQEHIQKLIDAAYARAASKFEKDYEKKVNDIQEAEKLKNMSDAEKQAHQLKKLQEELEAYKHKALLDQFKLELTGKNLPPDYADVVHVQDAEKAKKAVDFLAKYKEDVAKPLTEKIAQLEQELTEARLRGQVPKDFKNNPAATGPVSLSEIIEESVRPLKK